MVVASQAAVGVQSTSISKLGDGTCLDRTSFNQTRSLVLFMLPRRRDGKIALGEFY